jgi:class 3 adenylate cyclase/tetratricopeptide (TPR) repeat protein
MTGKNKLVGTDEVVENAHPEGVKMATGSTGTSRSNVPQRRYLTILFCDLVGYTELSEQLDPEDLRDLQLQYQRLALTVMERYGGFVAQFSGDGVLVYFGYPTAHENDAERAVRAALELSDRLEELNVDLRGQHLPDIAIRIGIHTGLIVIGSELASGGAQDHSIVGEAANLAARLQSDAPTNSVVVSGETFEMISGLFDYESLGPKRFKGITRIIPIYKITKPRVGIGRTYNRGRRGAPQFVGRVESVERVVACWNRAKEKSRCETVLITGEAGAGKTRLALEIMKRPELADATVLQIHCHDIFATTPLYSIGIFIWAEAGLTVDDDKAVRAQKLTNFLDNLGLRSPENEDIINSLLGMSPTSVTEANAPTPFLFKRKQFALLGSLFEQMARKQPTLIWVDDVHWIDPSSAELLQEIVGLLAKSAVLVMLTGRSFPKSPNLPQTDNVIELGQLNEDECYELARAIPRTQNLSDEELTRAVEAADGIPLFVEYLVLSLVDQKEQASIAARRRGELPLTLAAMISERLDRVADGRRVVQAAACIGRAFTADFLAALLQENVAKVIEPLEALIDAEILRPNHEDREVRFEFRHALLQRAAYESMVQSERRTTHANVVKELRRDGGAGPFVPELIAHHLTASGQFQEAIKTWLDAGANAARRSAHIEAIEDLRRGLGLLNEISSPELRAQLELNLQAALIASLISTQGPTSPALSECCQRGLALCKEGEGTPLVFAFLFGQFTFAMCRGRVEDATPLAQLFLSLASSKSYDSGRVIGHRLCGMTLVNTGAVSKAKEQLQQSLELYSAERDAASTHMFGQNTQVHSRSLLSIALFCLGQIDEALQVGLDALEAADALRHPHSTALAQGYVGGWLFGLCGAKDELMREAEQLIAVSEQHRLGPFRLFGSAFLGWALCQHGDLENGIAMLKKAIDKLESIDFRLSLPGHLAILADAQRRQGNTSDAKNTCERALALIADGTDRWIEPEVRRVDALVEADLKAQSAEKIEAKFREAVESARKLGFPVFEFRTLLSLQDFLGPNRKDIEVESRVKKLSHLQNLDRRVEAALKARGYNLRALAH